MDEPLVRVASPSARRNWRGDARRWLAPDVQKHSVVAQELAVGRDRGRADAHEVDELTRGWQLDTVDEAEGLGFGAVFGQLLVEVLAVLLEDEVEEESAVSLEPLVVLGKSLRMPLLR